MNINGPDVDVLNLQRLQETSQMHSELQVTQQENRSDSMQALAFSGKLAEGNLRLHRKEKKNADSLIKVCRKKRASESESYHKVKRSEAENRAREHSVSNPELSQATLMRLYERLDDGMSYEEIQELVEGEYSDPYLAHCAMEFLREVTSEDSSLQENMEGCIADYYDRYGREIQIGHNTAEETREFAEGSKMSPSQLRAWYGNIMNSKRGRMTTPELVNTMIKTFGYEKMVKAAHFYLRALGSEVRAGNVDFERAELSDRLAQIRSLQASLQVFRSSRKHMRVLEYALNDYIKRGFGQELP